MGVPTLLVGHIILRCLTLGMLQISSLIASFFMVSKLVGHVIESGAARQLTTRSSRVLLNGSQSSMLCSQRRSFSARNSHTFASDFTKLHALTAKSMNAKPLRINAGSSVNARCRTSLAATWVWFAAAKHASSSVATPSQKLQII